jgi:hypothetical protein
VQGSDWHQIQSQYLPIYSARPRYGIPAPRAALASHVLTVRGSSALTRDSRYETDRKLLGRCLLSLPTLYVTFGARGMAGGSVRTPKDKEV